MSIMPDGGWEGKYISDSKERLLDESNSGLILVGYVCCFVALLFLPPAFGLAGFVIGIVTLTKGRTGHGVVLIILSVTFGLTGMFIGARVGAKAWRNGFDSWLQNSPSSDSKENGSTTTTKYRPVIGETFSVGYWTYHCNGAEWQGFVASDFGSIEQPDAAYLIVDMTIRNDDRSQSTRPPMKLIDEQGREFSESSKSFEISSSISNIKELNPGVSSRGLILFDAPPQGKYMLKVSGGFESDEHKFIDMPRAQIQENREDSTGGLPRPDQ